MTDTIRKRHEDRVRFDAAIASRRASSSSANSCDGCRHWRRGISTPNSAALGKCCVSGSFRAPGGLFTEGGFGCIHWTKR